MQPTEAPSTPGRIELDLDPRPAPSRRSAPSPVLRNPLLEMPKLYPVLDDSMLGCDQTQQAVGVLILLSAALELVVALSRHGNAGNWLAVLVGAVLGIWMFSGSDFLRKVYLYFSVFQLGVSLLLLLLALAAGPLAITLVLLNGLSLVGMIYLLSGEALSRKKFSFCIASILLGKGLFALGALARG